MKLFSNSLIVGLLLSAFCVGSINAQEKLNVKKSDFSVNPTQSMQIQKDEIALPQGIATRAAKAATATLPYSEDFETGNLSDFGWVAIGGQNLPSTGYSLSAPDGNMVRYTLGNANSHRFLLYPLANSWAILPGIALEAGVTYRWAGYFRTNFSQGEPVTENVTVAAGTAATAAGMTEVLFDGSIESAGKWSVYAVEFTPDAAGTYYFGVKANTITGGWLALDDVTVVEAPTSAPAADFIIEVEDGVSVSEVPYGSVVRVADQSTNSPYSRAVYATAADIASDYVYLTASKENAYIKYNFDVSGNVTTGSQTIKVKVENGIGSDEKTIADAVTVTDRGYSNFPYVAHFYENENTSIDPFQSESLGVGYWIGLPRYARNVNNLLVTRDFYFEAGTVYRLTSLFAPSVVGGGIVQAFVTDFEQYGTWANPNGVNLATVLEQQAFAGNFVVPASGNYNVVYQLNDVDQDAAVFLLGMAIEEAWDVSLSENSSSNLNVYTAEKSIVVAGCDNTMVSIYSVSGQLVESRLVSNTANFAVKEGLYIVKVGEKATKVVVK